ncbi:hypothetical protein GCM10027051_28770 [Niabella terrae]
MKRLLFIVFAWSSLAAGGQSFNNEWINYGNTYYKFKIGSTGLYRIPQSVLAAAGLGTADVSQLQLWRNGVEQPMYTSATSGILGSDGYIEFWGQANDGQADLPLYRNAADQINDTRSLFTDSASYFLTINTTTANRRLETTPNTIPTGVGRETYFMYTATVPVNEVIHPGQPYGSGSEALYTSSYEHAEGWTSSDIAAGKTRIFSLTNLFPYQGSGAPGATIRLHAVGNAPTSRTLQLQVNNSLLVDSALNQYNYARFVKPVALSLLTSGTNQLAVTNTSDQGNSRLRVGLLELTYPRSFNFGGASSFHFRLDGSSTGKYLEITGFNYTGTPVLYDLANGRRYLAEITDPAILKFYLPASGTRELVLTSPASTGTIAALEARNFTNYLTSANQGNYLIITHSAILTGANGSQPVEAYRAYRSSAAGGGFQARIYMIDQLIDQFAFGIKQDPLAVRNFIRWARQHFSVPPAYVFIAAKGVKYTSARTYESAPEMARLNLVPTFGDPASDVLLAAEGSSSVPLTPIGRVPVINGNELTIYLEKVKEYEAALASPAASINESNWKKQIAHMIGANDQPTIDYLYMLLNQQKPIITDTLYGAQVTDFVKSDNSATQQSNAVKLTALINSGLAFLNYFGHSASNVLGFNLDDPANYTNNGKYPVFNMMGCNVGDIFIYDKNRLNLYPTISEKYVFAPERGCIAMLAGTALGYPSVLDRYNREFYKLLAREDYGASLGTLMQHTIINTFESVNGESHQLQRSQCEEFTLNGDPALRLYQFDKPDYAIEDQQLRVDPAFISVAETGFDVHATLYNLGKAPNLPLIVELKRTYPNNTVQLVKRDTIQGLRYSDSLSWHLDIDPLRDKGLNKLTITLDPLNSIDELFETNNSVTKDVFIYEDELRPVYPYPYAIVTGSPVVFSASTANPLATQREYIIEVDTTAVFNSSMKRTQTKTAAGGVVEFNPTVSFTDSTVYYWRVGSVPTDGEPTKWSSASFTYIGGGQRGLSMSHYYQWLQNEFVDMKLDSSRRRFEFDERQTSLSVTTAIGTLNSNEQASNFQLTVEDRVDQRGYIRPIAAQANCLRFYLIENNQLAAVKNQVQGSSGMYGSYSPVALNSAAVPWFFQFDIATAEGRNKVMQFLDSIPQDYYYILTNSPRVSTVVPNIWKTDGPAGTTLYDKFASMGIHFGEADSVYLPFAFIMQKGDTTAIARRIASNPGDVISLTAYITAKHHVGSMTSPILGPAGEWKTLLWNGSSMDAIDTDITSLQLTGIRKNGTEEVLLTGITPDRREVDISQISAADYPYLKLGLALEDSLRLTPFQLSNWSLLYTPVPEGAIAPNLFFEFKDTLDAGEPLGVGVAFKNISDFDFDSLKVKLTIRNKNNIETRMEVPLQKALISGDTLRFQVPVSSTAFTGMNQLYLEFNPDQAQPEQFSFNNFLYKNFFVRGDTLNPYMDVTFDGVRILNRDIVSSKPDILITLTDDAQYLLLNNKDLVQLQLRYPDGSLRDYDFNSDTLVFTPPGEGSNAANTATIHFRPHLMEDGMYELIVSGKDNAGNTAGDISYKVSFQVINKPMISNMLNYPNPFTSSTAFVFTLTGSEVPQNIRIQILTITGKIVREITKAELGPIRIGRNITEFKWDGTDMYGQKLANGVYLYRVLTNLNGKGLDKYKAKEDNTDRYFNKGYGKMVLIR